MKMSSIVAMISFFLFAVSAIAQPHHERTWPKIGCGSIAFGPEDGEVIEALDFGVGEYDGDKKAEVWITFKDPTTGKERTMYVDPLVNFAKMGVDVAPQHSDFEAHREAIYNVLTTLYPGIDSSADKMVIGDINGDGKQDFGFVENTGRSVKAILSGEKEHTLQTLWKTDTLEQWENLCVFYRDKFNVNCPCWTKPGAAPVSFWGLCGPTSVVIGRFDEVKRSVIVWMDFTNIYRLQYNEKDKVWKRLKTNISPVATNGTPQCLPKLIVADFDSDDWDELIYLESQGWVHYEECKTFGGKAPCDEAKPVARLQSMQPWIVP